MNNLKTERLSLLRLLPIAEIESENDVFRVNPDCVDVLNIYPEYYLMVGYSPPWIGYFASIDENEIIGCGGFKGRPRNGRVEIAYATFKQYERNGVGTAICKALVKIALDADPAVKIMARTLMEENASVKLLKKNGFKFIGVVNDEDDGDVWEWEYISDTTDKH